MVKTHFDNWEAKPKPDSAAYSEGYRCGVEGNHQPSDCHYPVGSFEANEWLSGLAMGAAERRTRK